MWTNAPNRERQAALDQAIADWKRTSGESRAARLSDAARDRILREANEAGAAPAAFSPLFRPVWRLAALGALPLMLLAVLSGWSVRPPAEVPVAAAAGAVPPVHVAKSGDEVIFLIANGNRAHAVYKSEQPNRFDSPPAFWTQDGAFKDSLRSGPDLVFYRID